MGMKVSSCSTFTSRQVTLLSYAPSTMVHIDPKIGHKEASTMTPARHA